VGSCGLDESGLGYEPLTDSCENRNKLSGCIKVGKFLD